MSKMVKKIIVLPETGEKVVLGTEDEIEDEKGPQDWTRWWNILKNGV